MTMTWSDDQWAVFCACIAEWWPGEFTNGARSAWRIALDAVEPEAAMVTAKRLLLAGEKFRPSCSSFLFAVRRDPSRPTFDEALLLLRRALSRTDTDRDALSALGSQPLVAAFAQRQGIPRLRTLPIDDPPWGEKHRRELRESWVAHVEAFDGREIAAIAAGSSDLRQLDPLASLQLGSGDAA